MAICLTQYCCRNHLLQTKRRDGIVFFARVAFFVNNAGFHGVTYVEMAWLLFDAIFAFVLSTFLFFTLTFQAHYFKQVL